MPVSVRCAPVPVRTATIKPNVKSQQPEGEGTGGNSQNLPTSSQRTSPCGRLEVRIT